jgi:hypothetical protein
VTTSRSIWLATFTLAALAHAGPALACGALPCAQINDVQPGDGNTGVPLNAEVRVLYFGAWAQDTAQSSCSLGPLGIRLAASGEANIDLTGTAFRRAAAADAWVVAKPTGPLLANTEYHVQVMRSGDAYGCDCQEAEWTTVSSFTTGSVADDDAPLFTGADSFRYGDRVDTDSDCGSFKAIPAIPHATAATDASPGLRYDIYVNDVLEHRYVENLGTPSESSSIYVNCGTTSLITDTLVTPGARVEVRAVDIAGNTSASNAGSEISVSCAPAEPAPPGASTEVAREDPQPSAQPACTLSWGGEARGVGGLWMLASLLGCGVRRRRG